MLTHLPSSGTGRAVAEPEEGPRGPQNPPSSSLSPHRARLSELFSYQDFLLFFFSLSFPPRHVTSPQAAQQNVYTKPKTENTALIYIFMAGRTFSEFFPVGFGLSWDKSLDNRSLFPTGVKYEAVCTSYTG